MRRLVLAALAAAALSAPALAEEGAGTGRANFYLELAADQERLRAGRAPAALPAETGSTAVFTRQGAAERRRGVPARPRR